MKVLISWCMALLFLAGAVNCFAMGGGEPQRPADERGMQDRVDTEPAWDPQQPPRTQEQRPGWEPDQQQQEERQTPKEFFGIGQEQEKEQQEQPQQSFNGFLDRAGEEWVLVVGDRVYELEIEDEQQVQGLMGRQVEVWGSIEEDTIQVDTVMQAGVILEQPETERPRE
jgi:hypothetical protein